MKMTWLHKFFGLFFIPADGRAKSPVLSFHPLYFPWGYFSIIAAENSHNLFNVSYTWYKSLKRTILHPPGSQWIFYMYPFGPSKVLCKLQPFEIQQVGLDIIEEEKVCVFHFADGIRLRNQNLFNLLINLLSLQPLFQGFFCESRMYVFFILILKNNF